MATVPGGLFDQTLTSSSGIIVEPSGLAEILGLGVSTTTNSDGSAVQEVTGNSKLANILVSIMGGDNIIVDDTQPGSTVITSEVNKGNGLIESIGTTVITAGTGQEATAQMGLGDGSTIAVTGGAGTAVSGKKIVAETTEAATQAAQAQVAELARNLGSSDEDSAGAREGYNATLAKLIGGLGADSIIGGAGSDTVVGGAGDDSDLLGNGGVGVELISISSGNNGRAEGDVTIVGSTEAEGESTVTMLDIFDLQSGASVNISEMENVMLIGGGRVVVTDDTNATIYGDTTDQIIVGGEGNDTLVGGGGNDSLVGGAGENTFGFTSIGNFTIEDFGSSEDLISFGDAGLQSLEDLAQILTGAADVDGNAVFTFFSGENTTTITLVGMSVNDITADMVNFDL